MSSDTCPTLTGAGVEADLRAANPLPDPVRPVREYVSCWLRRLEWAIGIIVVVLALALHIRFVTHVGGLWRDEANSVQLATLPSFKEVWHFLDYDSFPILFFAVLRGWLGIFGLYNDASLRALGCILGLGILAALWTNARALGVRWPLLSLALVGLNPMIIRYGDSTRAYGLGILLMLLTFRSFWRLVDLPSSLSPRRMLSAMAMALLSVQCLYYDSVLLLAIAAGAIAVALRARAWRTVMAVLGIGFLAACSLLPYLPMMQRMQKWKFVVSYPANLSWLWLRASEVMGSPDPLGIWIWPGIFSVGLGIVGVPSLTILLRHGCKSVAHQHSAEPLESCRRAQVTSTHLTPSILFASVALLVAVPAYAGFLWALHYYTQPWYYITLAVFVACSLEVIFGGWPRTMLRMSLFLRSARLLAVVMLLSLGALPAWKEMPIRHTDVDILGAQLQSLATKDDVILISHWQTAVSFSRAYRGPAEILTLPPMSDHRFHRYDIVLEKMMIPDVLRPVFTRLEAALRSGNHVFLVGALPLGEADLQGGTHRMTYETVWQYQAGYFLHLHITRGVPIRVLLPAGSRVQSFEDLGLSVFAGWK